jgi:hypothetical protein
MTRIRILILAAALMLGAGSTSFAQGRGGVGGGVGISTFSVPAAVGGYYGPFGYGGYGGYGYYGPNTTGYYGGYYPVMPTNYPAVMNIPYMYPPTVNTMGPLMQTIKKTTMSRRRR